MEKKAELIFIPAPGVGHLVPIIEFAKRLIINHHGSIQITILYINLPADPDINDYTQSLASGLNLILLPHLTNPPSPDILPISPEYYIVSVVRQSTPLVRDSVSKIISSSTDHVRVAAVVLDFFCLPVLDVATEFGLPSYMFLTTNMGYLKLMLYLPERHRLVPKKFEYDDSQVSIPGMANPVPVRVLPPALFNEYGYSANIELSKRFRDVDGILVNSFAELEPDSVSLRTLKVYQVGPVVGFQVHPYPESDQDELERVINWLNDQAESSVVFLCFGSKGSFEADQVKEIALALQLTDYRFLWCLRSTFKDEVLPKGFMEVVSGRGMICKWAPQVKILEHKAIGGFVSHCGWNSILESLWYGVPILTWPIYAEQQLNAFRMVKEMGLAVEMRLDYRKGGNDLVKAGEIENAISCLMDPNNCVRKKVKDMSDASRKALTHGGSSFLDIQNFIHQVTG